MMYIYLITNLVNGKVYVGQHKWKGEGLDPNYFCSSKNPDFWEDVRTLGINNFSKEIIQKCFSKTSLNIIESLWISYYRRILGCENVYNISDGGDAGWKNLTSEQLSKKASKANKTRLARGEHTFQHLTREQLLARAKKAKETLGPEGRSNAASKAARTQLASGTHPFQNLSEDSIKLKYEGVSKAMKRIYSEGSSPLQKLTPEKRLEIGRKAAITKSVDWVFHNPNTNEYRIHMLHWTLRYKSGFSNKLCRLTDWKDYCLNNNIDPNVLLGYKESEMSHE